jgi:hypothetical protein
MGEPKTSERRLDAADRQRRALELRRSGASFDAIAATLGYRSKSGAFKAVMTGLRATLREPSEELRVLELERLDALLRGIWATACAGDPQALDRALRIAERRAKLLALDGPAPVDVAETVRRLAGERGLDPDAALEAVRRAARELGGGIPH